MPSRVATMARDGAEAMAEAVMRDPSQLEMVRRHGQIIFTWTDEKNDKDTVKALKQLGVNGVIYDRMDWNNDKLVKESIFMTKERSVFRTVKMTET